MYRFSIFKWCN